MLGRIPSPPDPRDHPLARYLAAPPESIDLPSRLVRYSKTMPVYDQGQTPRCVAYSGSLMSTIDQRRDLSRTYWYDADEAYARCKEQDGIPDMDGTYPRTLLKIKQDRGIYRRGTTRLDLIERYARLTTHHEIKVAIYLWGSAQLGSDWYDEWFNPTKVLPEGRVNVGGHAYVAIGWSDNKQAFLIQNSWGPTWGYVIGGTGGRVWLPYRFVHLEDNIAWEAWRAVDARAA